MKNIRVSALCGSSSVISPGKSSRMTLLLKFGDPGLGQPLTPWRRLCAAMIYNSFEMVYLNFFLAIGSSCHAAVLQKTNKEIVVQATNVCEINCVTLLKRFIKLWCEVNLRYGCSPSLLFYYCFDRLLQQILN